MKLKSNVKIKSGEIVDIITIPAATTEFRLVNKMSCEAADSDGIEYPKMNKTAYYKDDVAFEHHDFCVYVWIKN